VNLRWVREVFTQPFGNRNKKVNLMMSFISFCDGKNSLLEIADRLNMPIWDLYSLIDELYSHDLIHSDE
jgi:aminopeptidase-like protein